ncbi:hypothetical protein OFAG_02171 [Oxalobacter formigenes HOxBLS]|uniref:Uncharacterized protein n=1 Tax=Oxalobacter paraformigenes TaxID=556268 RepID=T5LPY2_9BURK|nr:hypothetical protein OFAG_02171 [Oxalobacter paraformigenes]
MRSGKNGGEVSRNCHTSYPEKTVDKSVNNRFGRLSRLLSPGDACFLRVFRKERFFCFSGLRDLPGRASGGGCRRTRFFNKRDIDHAENHQ